MPLPVGSGDEDEKKFVKDNRGNTYEWKPKEIYKAELKAKREANKKKKWDDKPMSPEDQAKLDKRKAEWVGKTVKGVLLKRRGGFFIRFSDTISENVFCSEKNVIQCLGENKTPGMVAIVRCVIEKFGPPWKAWDKQHPITKAVELVTRYARRGREGENLAQKRIALGLSEKPEDWERNLITKDVDVKNVHKEFEKTSKNASKRSSANANPLMDGNPNLQNLQLGKEDLEMQAALRKGYPENRSTEDLMMSGQSHGLSKFMHSGQSQGKLDSFSMTNSQGSRFGSQRNSNMSRFGSQRASRSGRGWRSRKNSTQSRYSKRHPHPADDLGVVVDADKVPEKVRDSKRMRNKSRFSFARSSGSPRGSIMSFDKGTKQRYKNNARTHEKAVRKRQNKEKRRNSKGGPKPRINQPMKKTSF